MGRADYLAHEPRVQVRDPCHELAMCCDSNVRHERVRGILAEVLVVLGHSLLTWQTLACQAELRRSLCSTRPQWKSVASRGSIRISWHKTAKQIGRGQHVLRLPRNARRPPVQRSIHTGVGELLSQHYSKLYSELAQVL